MGNQQVLSRKKARKKMVDPSKPKRLFIYKDDLPGFNFDGDMEEEKLPVSNRRKQPKESTSSVKKEVKKKSVVTTSDPSKPKRLFIYKDDLPGFNFDGDMEEEKLPVSKKRQPRTTKNKTDSPKSESPDKEVDSDDDLESVDSTTSSTSSV